MENTRRKFIKQAGGIAGGLAAISVLDMLPMEGVKAASSRVSHLQIEIKYYGEYKKKIYQASRRNCRRFSCNISFRYVANGGSEGCLIKGFASSDRNKILWRIQEENLSSKPEELPEV